MNLPSIKICPYCKSSRIVFDMAGQTGKYECKKCGYVGVIVIERPMKKRLNSL